VRWSAWAVGVALVALAACTTAGTPAPAPPPPTAAPPSAAPTPAPTAAAPDALAFFRAQEESCKQFAAQQGIEAVPEERFRDAKVVRDIGDGTTEITDGQGTHLVVDPGRGIVLPATGKPSDVMPPPYAFTCSEKVFVGASAD
jgi:hypothetical protein